MKTKRMIGMSLLLLAGFTALIRCRKDEEVVTPVPDPANTDQYTITQAISDEARRNTISFDGLAFLTGNLGSQSFLPPGKVADYSGFQCLRDNDPTKLGHNTSFVTIIESNGIMEMARKLDISIIAYSPLAQGLVTGKVHDNPELLKNIGLRKYSSQFKPEGLEKSRPVVMLVKKLALRYNVTPSQIALNWLINYHGNTVVAISGATREHHARENTGALSFRLSGEDMVRLDEVSSIFK